MRVGGRDSLILVSRERIFHTQAGLLQRGLDTSTVSHYTHVRRRHRRSDLTARLVARSLLEPSSVPARGACATCQAGVGRVQGGEATLPLEMGAAQSDQSRPAKLGYLLVPSRAFVHGGRGDGLLLGRGVGFRRVVVVVVLQQISVDEAGLGART